MNKKKAKEIVGALSRQFIDKPALNFTTPYELLVAVILSAQCTDERVNKVTAVLFKNYNTPEKMLTLTQEELEKHVFSCGFYHNKAKHILSASKDIIERFNGKVPATLEELQTLAGVGRKTANVVYSVAFNKNAIAVDTHVFRVSNRIGLASENNVYKTELALMNILDEEDWSRAHHYLIYLGRSFCKAQNPNCENCPINNLCEKRIKRWNMFVDRAFITIKSGDGGNGITSFIHYKGKVGGGPDGGDGGKGGDIVFVADKSLNSLVDYYYKTKYVAENGSNGEPKECFGKYGKDLVLRVPLGTIIKDRKTGGIIADMFTEGQRKGVLVGGDGGKGNARFKNARRHAPHFSQTGEKTEAKQVVLELKTIAEVGLLGFPNVGKSTLLSKITKARPKIANYHFTTLSPNLGVCEYYDKQFTIADIPGIIEGASEGAGLGLAFLRHIERTRILVHVVDISGLEGRDPYEDYLKINAELKGYSKALSKIKQIIVANKCDVFGAEARLKEFKQKVGRGKKVIPISAITGFGIDDVKKEILKTLEKLPPVKPLEFEEFKYEKPEKLTYEILKEGETFVIIGTLVEVLKRNVVMTDMHSLAYMHKVLKDRGIIDELRKMGANEKSTIIIGGEEFELVD